MKLNEFIVENVLTALDRAAGVTVSQTNPGLPGAVTEVKRALAKHRIVTGITQDSNGNNTFQTADMGWSGPLDDTWSPALDTAIKLWKTSINFQDSNAGLNANTSEITERDVNYLIRKRRHGDDAGNQSGLLFIDNQGVADAPAPDLQFTGIDFNWSHVVDTPVEEISNTKTMLSAIGHMGWYAIFLELINKKGIEDRGAREMEIRECFNQLYVNQNSDPAIWYSQSWRANIVKRAGVDATATNRTGVKATLANGSEISFLPGMPTAGNAAQNLYTYFRDLSNGLMPKFAQENAEQRAQTNAPVQNVEAVMSDTDTTSWVRQMHDALEFKLFAYLPFGRDANADEDSVKNLMAKISSAGDWDKLEAAYATTFDGDDLSAELVNSLDDQQYESFVATNLLRVRRIQPSTLFAAINWPEGQDEDMEVQVDGLTYILNKALVNGAVAVSAQRRLRGGTNVKDVLVIDQVLKAAIESTGGTIPDINIAVTPENRALAGAMLVMVLDDKVPEMVAFYTKQVPFSDSPAGDLGPMRLQAILEEATVQVANGFSTENINEWILQQILDDREWLIGDGTEENPGAANVHFDSRYREDSGQTTGFGSSDDDVETTDEQNDLIARMINPEQRNAALAEIAAGSDVETEWDNIYRGYKSAHGDYIDDEITNEEALFSKLLGDTSDMPSEFIAIIDSIGPALAAPQLMAKLFLQSQSQEWFGFFGAGTNDPMLQALVDQIQNITDYDSVNERYKSLPDAGGEDLIAAVDGEQVGLWGEGSYVEQLKTAIGRSSDEDIELSRLDLTTSVQKVVRTMRTEATPENILDLKRLINKNNFPTIETVETMLELLGDVVARQTVTVEEQRTAFLEVVDDLGEQGESIDEDWFDDDFVTWKNNNSNQWAS